MRLSVSFILAFALGTVAALAPDVQAQQQQQQQGQAPVTGAAPTQLLADDLTGMEGKEVLARRSEAPGGWASKKHYHPGHVLVDVLEGAITFEEEGRPPITKKAGEMFHERPEIPLTARNASQTEPVKLLVIDIKDKGQPVTVDVQ
jgi:quercetin dioxygenase-like cupin family protein